MLYVCILLYIFCLNKNNFSKKLCIILLIHIIINIIYKGNSNVHVLFYNHAGNYEYTHNFIIKLS